MKKKNEKNKVNTKKEEVFSIVKTFTEQALKKHKDIIKSVVLIGSVATGEAKKESDIDIFIIIDDTKNKLTKDASRKIDDDMSSIAKSISKDLTIQPCYTLTEYMNMVRISHPLIFNFIRDGIAIYDTGFFSPIKRLLLSGNIQFTSESIDSFMASSPKRLRRANAAKMYMIEDVYYAMLNSVQAVLMFIGVHPPKPKKAFDVVKKFLVTPKLLERKYADQLKDIIDLLKKIEHKEIQSMSGANVDKWLVIGKKFVNRMELLLSVMEKKKKENTILKNYNVFVKTTYLLTKNMNISNKPERFLFNFNKYLIKSEIVPKEYLDLFKRLRYSKRYVEKGKSDKINDRDVYVDREDVRKYIQFVSKNLRKHESNKSDK